MVSYTWCNLTLRDSLAFSITWCAFSKFWLAFTPWVLATSIFSSDSLTNSVTSSSLSFNVFSRSLFRSRGFFVAYCFQISLQWIFPVRGTKYLSVPPSSLSAELILASASTPVTSIFSWFSSNMKFPDTGYGFSIIRSPNLWFSVVFFSGQWQKVGVRHLYRYGGRFL